ncbi:hypothetical protein CEXT_595271 [Caerostris extrusa]|uniref:Uncharacterized protein n=1 Tax=Caerostris extrusa TaxID=172846 RepID=A0AAV4UDP6_CAEEX|nr:hypothetical protein CEXT_595271 [Caerostris extrusa]
MSFGICAKNRITFEERESLPTEIELEARINKMFKTFSAVRKFFRLSCFNLILETIISQNTLCAQGLRHLVVQPSVSLRRLLIYFGNVILAYPKDITSHMFRPIFGTVCCAEQYPTQNRLLAQICFFAQTLHPSILSKPQVTFQPSDLMPIYGTDNGSSVLSHFKKYPGRRRGIWAPLNRERSEYVSGGEKGSSSICALSLVQFSFLLSFYAERRKKKQFFSFTFFCCLSWVLDLQACCLSVVSPDLLPLYPVVSLRRDVKPQELCF